MADNDDKQPPSGGRKRSRPFRVVRAGSPPVKPSSTQMRQLYMASEHIEWSPFCRAMGWDPENDRPKKHQDWITEKKAILAREQAENIAEMVFNHRSAWHKDVLKTLKEYPAVNDVMLGILKHRINDIIATINDDQRNAVMAAQRGEVYEPAFRKIKTAELSQISLAIRTLTESKHKSLMIDDWTVKVAEQFTDPKQFASEGDRQKDMEWKVEVIGGENLTNAQMQDFLGKWFDKPMHNIEPQAENPEVIDAESAES